MATVCPFFFVCEISFSFTAHSRKRAVQFSHFIIPNVKHEVVHRVVSDGDVAQRVELVIALITGLAVISPVSIKMSPLAIGCLKDTSNAQCTLGMIINFSHFYAKTLTVAHMCMDNSTRRVSIQLSATL